MSSARFFRLTSIEVEQVSRSILETVVQPDYVKKTDLIDLQSKLDSESGQRLQEINNLNEQITAMEQNTGSVISSLLSTQALSSTNQQEIIALQTQFASFQSQITQLSVTVQGLVNNSGSPSPVPEPEPEPEATPPTPTISRIPAVFTTRNATTYAITQSSVTAINSSSWKDGFFSTQSISKPGEYFEFRPIAAKLILGLANNTDSDSWKILIGGIYIRSLTQFSYNALTDSGSTRLADWNGTSKFRVVIAGAKTLEIQQETNGIFAHYHTVTSINDFGLLYPYGIMGGVPAKVADLVLGKF